MDATDIMDALYRKFPPEAYVLIPEAPEFSDRGGRKIDLLTISSWKSRGHVVGAIEIKVSLSDLRNELKRPEKSDFWYNHSHNFWLAVPIDLMEAALASLPPTWGLFVLRKNGTFSERVLAPRHQAEAFTWSQTIGLLRAAVGAGSSVLMHAEQRGYERGLEQARNRANPGRDFVKQELETLRDRVHKFEQASGIRIDKWPPEIEQIGELVGILLKRRLTPAQLAQRLKGLAQETEHITSILRDAATDAQNLRGQIPIKHHRT